MKLRPPSLFRCVLQLTLDDDDDADELGALRATAASGETTALLTREESDGALGCADLDDALFEHVAAHCASTCVRRPETRERARARENAPARV